LLSLVVFGLFGRCLVVGVFVCIASPVFVLLVVGFEKMKKSIKKSGLFLARFLRLGFVSFVVVFWVGFGWLVFVSVC
jgi:hypothetical protein